MPVNWVGLEKINEVRILDALRLALLGKSIQEIERETGIPTSSLYSIRKHGPTTTGTDRNRVPSIHQNPHADAERFIVLLQRENVVLTATRLCHPFLN